MTLYCILEVVVQVIEDTASLYIELFMHVILSQNVLHIFLNLLPKWHHAASYDGTWTIYTH